jgi:uncharacterized protein YceK
MNASFRFLFAASVLAFVQGCASYVTHHLSYPPDTPRVYRGTRLDAHRLREAIAPTKKDETYRDAELRTLILVFMPVDLPLSLVADTLLLPYDLMTLDEAEQSP